MKAKILDFIRNHEGHTAVSIAAHHAMDINECCTILFNLIEDGKIYSKRGEFFGKAEAKFEVKIDGEPIGGVISQYLRETKP